MKYSIFILISLCFICNECLEVLESEAINLRIDQPEQLNTNEEPTSVNEKTQGENAASKREKNNDLVPSPVTPADTIPKIPGIIPQTKLEVDIPYQPCPQEEAQAIILQVNGNKTSSILYLIASIIILYACLELYKHKQMYSFENLEPDMLDYHLIDD